MACDRVTCSVYKFNYIRVGGQILRIYPPLNKPKTLWFMFYGKTVLNNFGFGDIYSDERADDVGDIEVNP
jgi:hypothetical protein